MLRLYTLGRLYVEYDRRPVQLASSKARLLLAYLATFRGRPHSRALLAGTLWPNQPEEKARRRLSDTLWRLRRALGEYILADEESIEFNTALPYWLDQEELERKLNSYRRETTGTQAPLASHQALEEAVALYQGEFLEGIYDDWVLVERERLRGLYLQALQALLVVYKQTGDYVAALTTAQRLVAMEPFHEAIHREIMRLYHLTGRDAEAIAQYHHCRDILHRELNVTPSPETEALYQALVRRPSPATGVIPPTHLPKQARPPAFDLETPPLVGRDAERAALLGHLEAAASGHGGVLLLEGEAGIGKSRLAQELVAGARWRNIEVALATAAEKDARSYGQFLAALTPLLTPLRVRQLAHLVEAAHLRAIADLYPTLSKHVPNLPPLPDCPPPQARERLQRALIATATGLSRIAPHLWVLEDLQWSDAETLSLLPLLAPHLAQSRILLLITGRSAELRANTNVWETLQALDRSAPFHRYRLSRLSTDAVQHLVENLLGVDAPAITEHLMQSSEGVPLYLVETLKTWRNEGYLQPTERGTWSWQGGAPDALPIHLGEAVIGHRLSHLSPEAERILAAAAVIGAEVDFDLLTVICCQDDPDGYLHSTDELLRQGLLIETDTGYRFSHEQIRRAVYHRLPPSRRQRLHHRVAQAIETLFPQQFEWLAHHFVAAGHREPGIHYLTRAAERARELFAHRAALADYDRLLALLTRPEDAAARYKVLGNRAEVLSWIGDRQAQGETIEEMLALARALSDPRRRAETLYRRSEWHRLQGEYPAANRDAQAALDLYRQLGDERGQAALLGQLGWNTLYASPDEADPSAPSPTDYLQEALDIYRALGDAEGQIHCLIGLASAAANFDGLYARSLAHSQRCMALARESGDPHLLARAFLNLALSYLDLSDLDASREHLQQALKFARATNDQRRLAVIHFYLGEIEIEAEQELEVARTHLDTALRIFRRVRDRSWEGDTLSALGRLALLQGRPGEAREYLQASLHRRRELGEPAYAVIDCSYLAVAELSLGDEESAWQHSLAAVAELETGLSGVELPQRVYYNHFRVAEATRHWAAARAALENAARIVEERAQRIEDSALRATYRNGAPLHQVIVQAADNLPPPGRLRVRLPRADVPARRSPRPDETVPVVWTVDAGPEDSALAQRCGRVALRRHRILRLLAEAEAAGALPTVADLAGALDVSRRTIRSDLAALRRQGHTVHTRGRRPPPPHR